MFAADAHSDYKQCLAWLNARINYERKSAMPAGGVGLKLDRMRALVAGLNNPERRLRIVHIAGTKGKGSTAAMIASVMRAAGLRTGLFTSPHLNTVRERLAIDGQPCARDTFAALVQQVRPVVESLDAPGVQNGPTYFEITTAMALLYFAQAQVDVVVLEVGLGGRLDSTNICLPEVSVITSISLDHTRELGDTTEKIAREKAGIIKSGVPVICGVLDKGPRETIAQIAADRGCRFVQRGHDFDFRSFASYEKNHVARGPEFDYITLPSGDVLTRLRLRLLGAHQVANAAVAVATINELRQAGWRISDAAIRQGLARATLPARVEVVAEQPIIIVDAAHNGASMAALAQVLEENFRHLRRTLVFGTTVDKDADAMLSVLLPLFERVVWTRYQKNPRAVAPQQLQQLAGGRGEIVETPEQAWRVVSSVPPGELIVVTGSFYLAAEMRRIIARDLARRELAPAKDT